MNVSIKSNKVQGELSAISSKSVAHRLLICAAFSDKKTTILCERINADIVATVNCLKAFGACIEYDEKNGTFEVTPVKSSPAEGTLPCNESGSTLRFILPIACALGGTWHLLMSGSLPQRPLSPLKEELEAHGINFSYINDNELCVKGKLTCGNYEIAGNVSSQFISGLLFALSILKGKSDLKIVGRIESAPYIGMTQDALKIFGADITTTDNGFNVIGKKLSSPENISVEGDWSNAAFPLCAAALSRGSVTLNNINTASYQGDMIILDLLKKFGAEIICSNNCVTVLGNELHYIDNINAEQFPDLVPILATVACGAKGTTRISGASRLKIKECDRLQATYDILLKLGADISLTDDGFIIRGKERLNGGTVDSCNDHRMAMSAAIASCICENRVTVTNADAVAKSYPDFWKDMKKIGFEIE